MLVKSFDKCSIAGWARTLAVLLLLTTAMVPAAAPPADAAVRPVVGELVDIGGTGRHIVLDRVLGRAYVTFEERPAIAVVDIASRSVVDEYTIGGVVGGIRLSPDRSKLYLAYIASGVVAEVDAATGTALRGFDIAANLGTNSVSDVEVIGNDLFAVPNSNPGGPVVKIDLTTELVTTVAAGYEFTRSPRLIWGGTDSLYVSHSHSPNSLYRLDLTDPAAPVVAEDDHGDVERTYSSLVVAGGTRLLTAGGQEVDALTLDVVGLVPEGVPAASDDGPIVFFAQEHGTSELRIRRYNLDRNKATGSFDTTCGRHSASAWDMEVMEGNTVFIAATDAGLCIVDTTMPIPDCDGRAPTILGTALGEEILGTSGDDVIVALGGDDLIEGRGGNDWICAGSGNDTVIPDNGSNHLSGDAGIDTITFAESPNPVIVDLGAGHATGYGTNSVLLFENVIGSVWNDTIYGSGLRNVLEGLNGRDLLVGRSGHDSLFGGKGNDILDGGNGRDRLWGGANDDLLRGGAGNDRLMGESGLEDMAGYETASGPIAADLRDHVATGQGTDKLIGIEGVIGSDFDDVLIGDSKDNVIIGRGGADELRGGGGQDTLDGWEGPDTLYGGAGGDILLGHDGPDILFGGPGADVLAGELGDDTLKGGPGADAASFSLSVQGVVVDLRVGTAVGEGSDTLESIRDIVGTDRSDTITGSSGRNVILGLGGDDEILGLASNDRLDGGDGSDSLRGGSGADICAAGESYASCETIIAGQIAADRILEDGYFRHWNFRLKQ